MGENKYPSWMNAFQPEAAYENLKDFLPIFKFRVIDRLFPKQMSFKLLMGVCVCLLNN